MDYRLLHVYHSSKRAGNTTLPVVGSSSKSSHNNPKSTPSTTGFLKVTRMQTRSQETNDMVLTPNETWSSISSSHNTCTNLDDGWDNMNVYPLRNQHQCTPLPYQITPMDPTISFLSHHEQTMCSILLSTTMSDDKDEDGMMSKKGKNPSLKKQWTSQRRQGKRRKRKTNVDLLSVPQMDMSPQGSLLVDPPFHKNESIQEEALWLNEITGTKATPIYPIQESKMDASLSLSPWMHSSPSSSSSLDEDDNNNNDDDKDDDDDELNNVIEFQSQLDTFHANLVQEWKLDSSGKDEGKGHLVMILVDWAKNVAKNPIDV